MRKIAAQLIALLALSAGPLAVAYADDASTGTTPPTATQPPAPTPLPPVYKPQNDCARCY